MALLFQPHRQLTAGRCFAGTLQTTHHDDAGAVTTNCQRVINGAHQVHQFLMHNPHDLLVGAQSLENLFADRLFGDSGDEVLYDVVGHVGFQQRLSDLLHAFADVALGDLSGTAESTERLAQTLCN